MSTTDTNQTVPSTTAETSPNSGSDHSFELLSGEVEQKTEIDAATVAAASSVEKPAPASSMAPAKPVETSTVATPVCKVAEAPAGCCCSAFTSSEYVCIYFWTHPLFSLFLSLYYFLFGVTVSVFVVYVSA